MAQFQARKGVTTPYPKDKISQLAREVHSDGWVYFRESIKAKPEEIATKHKEAFGLGVSDVLQSTGTQIDELKTTRFRYQQLHAGIPVEGADFSIYARDGRATHAAGKLVPTLNQSSTPGISEAKALATALAAVPAKVYVWQDKALEEELKRETNNSKATHFPVGKMLYALPDADPNESDTQHRLAYRFEVMRIGQVPTMPCMWMPFPGEYCA